MLALGLLASATATSAQAPPPAAVVALRELPCEPARYDANALYALLEVELRALGLALRRWSEGDAADPSSVANAALALLTLRCGDAPDLVELELDDLAAKTHSARSFALSDVPHEQRARTLALALVSALEQSLGAALLQLDGAARGLLPPETAAALRARMVQRLRPPPATAATARAAAAAPVPVPAAEPEPRAVELAAMTRVFPSYSTALLGVQAGAALELAPPWTLDLDAEALLGQSELSDARGTVGTMWLYWLSAGVGLSGHSTGNPELALGPRLRVGYSLADAKRDREDASAKDDDSPLLAALLTATLRAPIGQDASLLVGMDAGYTIVGIVFVGDQTRLSGMAGITLGVRVGVAL